MIRDFCLQNITSFFPYKPNTEQYSALHTLSDFIALPDSDSVLIFKGFAGTGKTTTLGAVVKMMDALHRKVVLLAPTGRAAKVFAEYADHSASTIHKKIYRQKNNSLISGTSSDSPFFSLSTNLHKNTLFIVDEASMISNEKSDTSVFGSGRLLDDLIYYVYSGADCSLILTGDPAQLPPVSQTESPALSAAYLKKYDLRVTEIQLTQVVRQQESSGILYNATNIRNALQSGEIAVYPTILTEKFADIRKIDGNDLIEELSSAYGRDGIDDTIVICRSNKNANIYNMGIRNRILFREEELSSNDRLMVVKNNYYWGGKEETESDFIANGEIIQVLHVRKMENEYGFRFCNVLVRFIDYDIEIELKIMLDTILSESPALPHESNEKFFTAVNEAYADIRLKSDRIKMIKNDPYFNALQVKYAYAVTCHKAQGGQWSNVFIDIGYVTKDMMGENFYHWLYTAFTRATKRLYLVNWRLDGAVERTVERNYKFRSTRR